MAVQDWYSTYAGLAGVDATDHRAAAAGLPPVDGVDMWPLLSGARATSPRTEVQIGDSSTLEPNGDGDTLVGGIINGSYKLLVGAAGKLHTIDQDVTTGPLWPNASSHLVPLSHERTCGRKPKNGCLFDIFSDPLEEHSLAEQMPDLFASMLARVDELQKGVYSPKRGGKDKAACTAAMGRYGGYWGPFVDVDV